jgi:hypothetical protein
MNNPIPVMANRSSFLFARYTTWATLLTSIFLTIALTVGFREYLATQEIQQLREEQSKAGIPIDASSLQGWLDSFTTQENASEWHELIAIAATEFSARAESIVTAESPDSNEAAQLDRIGEPYRRLRLESPEYFEKLDEFVQLAGPWIQRIQGMKKVDKPIWFPLEAYSIIRWPNFVSESRSVLECMHCEVLDAMHDGDPSRAKQGLVAMRNCIEAFDWHLGEWAGSVTITNRYQLYQTIEVSLARSFWDPQQLDELIPLLVPLDLEVAWRRKCDFSFVFLKIANFYEPPLPSLPRVELDLMHWNNRCREIATNDRAKLYQRASQLDWSFSSGEGNNQAIVYVTEESRRRMCLAGIRLKQFHREFERWPKDLSELVSSDFSGENLQTPLGEPFELSIEHDDHVTVFCAFANLKVKVSAK